MQIIGLLNSIEEANEIKSVANVTSLGHRMRMLARKGLVQDLQNN